MNEETKRAQQMGELIAEGRARGEQLAKLERSICELGKRVERKLDEHAKKFDDKVTKQSKANDKTYMILVTHLAQLRVVKWLLAIIVPVLIALGFDWWNRS